MNKKGTLDNIWVAIQVFGFALFLVVIVTVWNLFTADDMEDKFWNDNLYSQSIQSKGQKAFDRMDDIYMMAYFGVHLGILVLAFFLRSHPVVLIAIFFIAAIIALVSAPLSNVYDEIVLEPDLAGAKADLPKTDYIIRNLPKFEVIWTFITAIVLVGLARME
jgi:hypothetical protein